MLVVAGIIDLDLPEGDVADGGVKEAVGNVGRLKALYGDAVLLIKLLSDSS